VLAAQGLSSLPAGLRRLLGRGRASLSADSLHEQGKATGTFLRPIKNPYRMTNPTMIHARVATTTLPPNTSGKKRPQLSFDQGATVGNPSRRVPYESPLCE
jgi:hypothetical protein